MLSQRFLYSLNRHVIAGTVATLLAGGSQRLVVFMITVSLEVCSTLLVESNLEMQEFFSWERVGKCLECALNTLDTLLLSIHQQKEQQ